MNTDMEKCIKTMLTNICLNFRWVFALTVFKLLLFANCKYLQEQVFTCKDAWRNTIFSAGTYSYVRRHSHMDIRICYLLFAVLYCSLYSQLYQEQK